MLEPRIEAMRKQYGLQTSDFWQIPQNKQWVCKHAALEIVAVTAGVVFDMPVIINTDVDNRNTSMIVRGTMGERSEWATGETNTTNYSIKGKQPAYPWAMSEKRAKDRVILKLVGIHGLVYSEDEADFTQPKASSRETFTTMTNDLKECVTMKELGEVWNNVEFQGMLKSLPSDWKDQVVAKKEEQKSDIEKAAPVVSPHETLEEQFG